MEAVLALFAGTGRAEGGDIQKAQNIMYAAWDADSQEEAVRLATEALAVCPECADAYNLLAETRARSIEEALDLYQAGVKAGERALGERVFEEDVGHFWGLLETRPYMRARAGVALCLWSLERHEESVDHDFDLLRLNPNDNQGVRWSLIAHLTELDRDGEASEFHDRNPETLGAAWTHTRASLLFRKSGDSKEACEARKAALDGNPCCS